MSDYQQGKDTKRPRLYDLSDEAKADTPDYELEEPQPDDFFIIHLRTDEVALLLWTFERDSKTNEWILSGTYRTGILEYLQSQSFAKRYRPDQASTFLIRGEAIIEPVIDTILRDSAKAYIQSMPYTLTVDYLAATYEGRMEIFNRQQHLTINSKSLEGLQTHTRPLLRDNETTCYVPYRNGIIQITAAGVRILPYEFLDDRCVWASQVLKRDFDPTVDGQQSHIALFLINITNREPDRLRAFRTAIGYLIHNHVSQAEGQAVLCYDEEVTDARKPEGGTGKGVFGNAIRQIRPMAVIDGKKFDQNDRFCFQQVNEDTAVVWIDDPVVNHPKPERRFTLERFFSLLTEGWAIEKNTNMRFAYRLKKGLNY
jgi:hypothetical protein